MKHKVGDKTILGEIIWADEETFMYTISMKQGMFSSTMSMSEFWIDNIIIKPKSCEWCEIASECEYEVTFFRDDDRWATRRSLVPKFCPNCGRRLEDRS